MKTKILFNSILAVFWTLTLYTIVNEYVSTLLKSYQVNSNSLESIIPEKKIIPIFQEKKNPFIYSQVKGTSKRITRTKYLFMKFLSVTVLLLLFFWNKPKNYLKKILNRQINIIPSSFEDINLSEFNYVYIIAVFGIMITVNGAGITLFISRPISFSMEIFYYILEIAVLIPGFILLVFYLFKIYGLKVIIICYITYFIKETSEILEQDGVDLVKMRPVSLSEFSNIVQKRLTEENLDQKIYIEKKKSLRFNAALVSWGSNKRIEIYGDYSTLTREEFESVLLHEIGHSSNNSLEIKIAALFAIKILEFGIMVGLYVFVVDKYADETLTKTSIFIVMWCFYQLLIYNWLLGIHKLIGQIMETSSDMKSKQDGYGKPLSNVLLNIAIHGNENIFTTFLYNFLHSYHPPIYDRISILYT